MRISDLSPKARATAKAIATHNGLTVAELLRYVASLSRPQNHAKMSRVFFAHGVSKHSQH